MMITINTFLVYLARILPGLAVIIAVFPVARPNALMRVGLYLLAFVLLRDAMTPLGLWRFGTRDGVFWIRLSDDPWFLAAFGLAALAISLALLYLDGPNREQVHLFPRSSGRGRGIIAGIVSALLVVLPFWGFYQTIPIALRGGAVARHLLPAILVFALLGNFMEELLFRGYVLGYLRRRTRMRRHTPGNFGAIFTPGVQSGVIFALCHVFLAVTVTGVGAPLLLFTVWEGVIAGVVGERYGVIPATLTHGGAIFLLSSGLV